jgi:hypothetical protein
LSQGLGICASRSSEVTAPAMALHSCPSSERPGCRRVSAFEFLLRGIGNEIENLGDDFVACASGDSAAHGFENIFLHRSVLRAPAIHDTKSRLRSWHTAVSLGSAVAPCQPPLDRSPVQLGNPEKDCSAVFLQWAQPSRVLISLPEIPRPKRCGLQRTELCPQGGRRPSSSPCQLRKLPPS